MNKDFIQKETLMKTLVIIPAYNEHECLKNTVDLLCETLPGIDFVVVNDGSKDDTYEICLTEGYPCINLPANTGLTSAFQAGMKYAHRNGYDSAVQFDADGQHLPEYIPLMQEAMEQKSADVVIASRFLEGEKPTGARGAGSKLISFLIRATTPANITDPTSGMRMYSKALIERYAKGFDLAPEPDTIAYFARTGYKVVEIPAKMRERQGGESYFDLPNIIAYMSKECSALILFQWFR